MGPLSLEPDLKAGQPLQKAHVPDSLHLLAMSQLLSLLAVANGAPLFAKKLFGRALSSSIDRGLRWIDGRPLFGTSKTVRGVVCAVLATSLASPLVGLSWTLGILIGSMAMVGDLFSSFLKRRLGRPPSSRATGLDQVPESLFPLLVCRHALSLTATDITVAMAAFFVGEVLLSRLLFVYRIREQPY